VNIKAFAQGPHAQAVNVEVAGQEREECYALIRELEAVLRQHDGELADGEAVDSALDEVSGELERERPDRSRLRALLDKLAAAAGPIADIATVVATVQRAISGMG
jgi:uncharacterized protein DUF5955